MNDSQLVLGGQWVFFPSFKLDPSGDEEPGDNSGSNSSGSSNTENDNAKASRRAILTARQSSNGKPNQEAVPAESTSDPTASLAYPFAGMPNK